MIRALMAMAALIAAAPASSQAPRSDIPLIVLVNDGDPHTMGRSNGLVQEALGVLREQFARDGYDVKTGDMLEAGFDWNLEKGFDTSELLRIAAAAKQSGRPEFDVRAVVIFSMSGIVKDQGFATKLDLTIHGSVYDTVSQRQLSKFGPLSQGVSAPADCSASCIEEVGRPIANRLAAIVGDEALQELAQITFQPEPATAGRDASAEDQGISYDSGLTTTYAIHFEDFSQSEMFEVIELMETEFPEFVSSRGVEGSARRGTYGYLSRASGQDLYRWLVMLLTDMGLDPDTRSQVRKQGTQFTLKKLGGA